VRPDRLIHPLAIGFLLALTTQRAAGREPQRIVPGAKADSIGSGKRLGVIDGIVTDTGLAPIPSVEVVVVSRGIAVRTGPNGRFRLVDLPQGSCIVIVRRIGFFPASMILHLSSADTLRVSFALRPATVDIGVVTVLGERGQSLRLLEFEYRRRYGVGRYMTKRDIERRGGVQTADLLRLLGMPPRLVPGDDGEKKWYVGAPPGVRGISRLSADGSGTARFVHCEGRVFLNGVALPAPVAAEDLPKPGELAGIEVYRGVPPPIPLDYGGLSACGDVIMLWTTSG
jgi:hypothetical protein